MTSLHADNDAYLDYYQFPHDPFADRVPGMKFFPAQRKPVLAQLHHLTRYSQLMLVVSGPYGSGKTLLRQAMVASTDEKTVMSQTISGANAADASALLRQIAQGIGLSQADPSAILRHLGELGNTNLEVHLLVDDAHLLTDPALEALLRLSEGNDEGRAHVFLFTEPELLPRLNALAAGREIFHAIQLQPYNSEDVRGYLAERLETVNQGLELFTEDQLEEIMLRSGGWPGAINEAAREVLIEDMDEREPVVAATTKMPKLPWKHLIALAAVVLVLLLLWVFSSGKRDEPSAPAAEVSRDLGEPSAPAAGQTPIVFDDANTRTQTLPLPLNTGSDSSSDTQPAADTGQAQPQPASVPEPSVPAPTPAPAPAPVPAPAPAPTPKPAASTPQPSKPAAAKPQSQPRPAAVTSAVGDSAWYAKQPAGRYTLQLLASRSETAARAVASRGSDYHYFRKSHQGQSLFVVTYGNFANRDAALAAVNALPADLQSGKPWARSFGSIREEIR